MTPEAAGITVSLDRLVALARVASRPTPPGTARTRAGGLSGRQRGDGADLFDVRPYQEGDDARHLDPAATARSGKPQIRTFHEDVDRTALLVADFRAPMLWGTRGRLRSVAAAEALALEGWALCRDGARVGLHAAGDPSALTLPPRPREPAMLDIAGGLSRAHSAALDTPPPPGMASLADIIGHATSLLSAGATLILATGLDHPGPDFAAVVRASLRKCRLQILLVLDPIESAPPAGAFAVREGARVRTVRFQPSAKADMLVRLGLPVQIVRTDSDPFAEATP